MIEFSRRRFLSGLVGLVAAPAIVRVSSLMPVKAWHSGVYGYSPAQAALPLLKEFDLLVSKQFNVKDFFPWADTMADVIRPGIFPGCEPPDGFPRQICGAAADGLTTGSGDLDYRHYP